MLLLSTLVVVVVRDVTFVMYVLVITVNVDAYHVDAVTFFLVVLLLLH